jgi:hypothetical protein
MAMTGEPQRPTIRLELTGRQKKQLRRATGRTVNALELRLQDLPEPPSASTPGEGRSNGDTFSDA